MKRRMSHADAHPIDFDPAARDPRPRAKLLPAGKLCGRPTRGLRQPVDCRHQRLSAGGGDLLAQPLKVLERALIGRKEIGGSFERERARLSQAPHDLGSQVWRLGGRL
jgi:hypothetical protein